MPTQSIRLTGAHFEWSGDGGGRLSIERATAAFFLFSFFRTAGVD